MEVSKSNVKASVPCSDRTDVAFSCVNGHVNSGDINHSVMLVSDSNISNLRATVPVPHVQSGDNSNCSQSLTICDTMSTHTAPQYLAPPGPALVTCRETRLCGLFQTNNALLTDPL